MKTPAYPGRHPSFIARQIEKYRYFFLDLAPSRKSRLGVACGGWESCAPDYEVNRADLSFFGIEYVAAGRGTLVLGNKAYELSPGVIFAYRPFTPHIIRTSPEEPLVKYFVDFLGKDAGRIAGPRTFGKAEVALLHDEHLVRDLFEQMIETGLKGGRFAARACTLLLDMLALRIEENANELASAQSQARRSFERTRAALQEHFRTLRSVSDLAQRINLDPAYLSRLYRRYGGEAPYDVMIRLKMNEAAANLIGGHFTVKEVAAQVGFPDPYHFSRAFKRHYGVAPARFRSVRTLLR